MNCIHMTPEVSCDLQTIDYEIEQTAINQLQLSPYFCLRSIAVDTRGGVLALKGQVASYFQKQLAQETVRNIKGVVGLVNDLIVIQQPNGS
jgi:osmotically-inducible protein OsmY